MKKIISILVVFCLVSSFPSTIQAEIGNGKQYKSMRVEQINVPRVIENFPGANSQRTVKVEDLIEMRAFGDRHRLSVPTCVQENSYYCGPASLQQLLKFKGKSYSQSDLARRLGTTSRGSDFIPMRDVLNKIMLNIQGPPPPTGPGYRDVWLPKTISAQNRSDFVKRLKQDISYSDPLIFWVDVSVLYPGTVGGHFVTGCGWKEGAGGSVSDVYYIDPWGERQDATYKGLKIAPLEEMLQAMAGKGYIW